MITLHNLGYPRIGRNREMKYAIERYWSGRAGRDEVTEAARDVRTERLARQADAGLAYVPVGDFPWYDHVLQTSIILGVVPERFQPYRDAVRPSELDLESTIARGISGSDGNIEPSAMLKWFDTNYHYIAPELTPETRFTPDASGLLKEIHEAVALGHAPKPVLPGPMTYLRLAGAEPDRAAEIAEAYAAVIAEIAPHVEWLQLDEPVLALDLPAGWHVAFRETYAVLARAAHSGDVRIMVATYFGPLAENLPLLLELPVHGVHLDAVRAPEETREAAARVGEDTVLSVGIVNGRNIWRNDLAASLEFLAPIAERLGDRLWLAPSCSLLHVPIDAEQEIDLPPEVKATLAFADQKLTELSLLKRGLEKGADAIRTEIEEFARVAPAHANARRAPGGTSGGFDLAALRHKARRDAPYEVRRRVQRQRFSLPAFPTTTIGSFPQTAEIRAARRQYRAGEIDRSAYDATISAEIDRTISVQEDLGLDVLVHGEAERTDMVEYFGRKLDGFVFTKNGWVQSYGTRCVKPPIIHGDVTRPEPMTVEWARYAQSRTERPVKGMLTGPITILQWSFAREDQPRRDTALQIALALRDEVDDLERAGIGIIQVDEPALREGLPLRRAGWDEYLEWATLAFRLATSAVTNQTQIHTHMCYSRFNDIIEAIARLDADVITIEAARSRMNLLDAFERFQYPNEIGPGVYDIHSPLIPRVETMVELLERALTRVPADRLWVNPDCGLKTRTWDDVTTALGNMVAAARIVRERHAGGAARQDGRSSRPAPVVASQTSG